MAAYGINVLHVSIEINQIDNLCHESREDRFLHDSKTEIVKPVSFKSQHITGTWKYICR